MSIRQCELLTFAPETQALLEVHIPRELAFIAHEYLAPSILYDDIEWARVGHGEGCEKIKDTDVAMSGACHGNHILLVKLMIARGFCDPYRWDDRLCGACNDGNVELAKLMIDQGATYVDVGLYHACRKGHIEVAKLMIAEGATQLSWGLEGAYMGNHSDIMSWIIGCGAIRCPACCQSMDAHHARIAEQKGCLAEPN